MTAEILHLPRRNSGRVRQFLSVAGPGIVVMLADTDAGSVVTAAQSGAQWGYKLLAFQFVLIPILYLVQELTVRLGIVTGEGHAALIHSHFGRVWAWVSVSTLLLACIGALLTEFAGLAGIGNMMGVPTPITMTLAVATLTLVAITGSYRSVERIALAVGLFEFAFIVVAVIAHPTVSELARDTIAIPFADPKYLLLVSANIGAVIMTCPRTLIQLRLEPALVIRRLAWMEQRAIGGAGRGCAADRPLRRGGRLAPPV